MTTAFLATPSPIPVHVTDAVRIATEPDKLLISLTVMGALASISVAFFTYVLARQTRTLATETKQLAAETSRMADETTSLARETLESVTVARMGSSLADRHHQEMQSAIVVMKELRLVYNAAPAGSATDTMRLCGQINNVGFGPALGLYVSITPDGGTASRQKEIGTIEVGPQTVPPAGYEILFDRGSVPDLPQAPPATVTLWYRNIFGGSRTTTYILRASPHPESPVVSETVSTQEIVTRSLD